MAERIRAAPFCVSVGMPLSPSRKTVKPSTPVKANSAATAAINSSGPLAVLTKGPHDRASGSGVETTGRPAARYWRELDGIDRLGQLVDLERDQSHVELLAIRRKIGVRLASEEVHVAQRTVQHEFDRGIADQHEVPIGTPPGDLGQEIQIDPVADQPEETQPRTGNRRNVRRGRQIVGDGLRRNARNPRRAAPGPCWR